MSNLGETLLIKAINEYESQNGKIETEEKQGIHIQNSNGVVVRDNKGQVIVGDIKGNVHM
jgi:hypothetical protein